MGKPKMNKYRRKRHPMHSKRSKAQRLRLAKEKEQKIQNLKEQEALAYNLIRQSEYQSVRAVEEGEDFPQLQRSARTYGDRTRRHVYQPVPLYFTSSRAVEPLEFQSVHAVEEGEGFPQLQHSIRTYGNCTRRCINMENASTTSFSNSDTLNVHLEFTSEDWTKHGSLGNSALDVPVKVESILPDIPDKVESILSDVPNLAIVKKEPVDTEDIYPSTSVNISSFSSSNSYVPSVKLEINTSDDCLNDITIPVNPDYNISLASSTDSRKKISAPLISADGTEPPPKKPNLSKQCSSTEIKDEFSVFGSYVADKIRSFTDRHLQVEAQHRITNLLFELEMKDLNKDSLPVISKISSVQKPLPAKVTLPSTSSVRKISSLQRSLLTKVTQPSSFAVSKISNLQTQIPVTMTQPCDPAFKISSLQTSLPVRATLSSSSSVSKILNLQPQLPTTLTLCSSSATSSISSSQTQLPVAVTLPSTLALSRDSNFQSQIPATVTSASSSSISEIPSLQEQMSVAQTLPTSLIVPSLQTQMPVTAVLPSSLPVNRVTSLQEQMPVTMILPSSSFISFQKQMPSSLPVSIAPSLQIQLPSTVLHTSSSVIPFVSGNTIDLKTQIKYDVPKQS